MIDDSIWPTKSRRAASARAALICFAASACGSVSENHATSGTTAASATSASASTTGGGGSSSGTGGSDGTGGIADCTAPQISVLATPQDDVNGIALDDDNVYWTNNQVVGDFGQIRRVPKAGGPISVITSTGKLTPWDIAVDGSHVYWSTRGSTKLNGILYPEIKIFSAPKAGGPFVATELSSTFDAMATGIAVDDKLVYWTTDHDELLSAPKASIKAFATIVIANDPKFQLMRRSISVDASHLYWMEGDVNIASMPKSGGSLTTLATQPPDSLNFAMDAKRIYWGDTVLGHISSIPKGGGAPKILADGEEFVLDIAVNSSCVYWLSTNHVDARVRAVSKNGGAVTTIATPALTSNYVIAADETHVYWVDRATHSLMQASK